MISSLLFAGVLGSAFTAAAQDFAYFNKRVQPASPAPLEKTKIVSENEVSIRSVRDFRKSYATAKDVKWVTHKNGASVFFTDGGVKMRSSYHTNGRKEYTLKYYEESQMAPALRHRVKSQYYDYRIIIVTEVMTLHQTYYLVKMENDKQFLTLRIADDDLSEYERIKKVK